MYRGEAAEYQIGVGGYDGNRNLSRIAITNLIMATNIRFDGDAFVKAPGLNALQDTPLFGEPQGLAGFDWHPVTNLQHQITVWANGKVYKEVAGDVDAFELKSGLTFTQPVTLVAGDQFREKQKKLYLYSQGVQPQILTSVSNTMVPMTKVSGDWQFHSFLQVHGILYTAVESGAGGDAITIKYENPGSPSSPLSVSVVGTDIVVSLGTNSSSVITTTAYNIIDLITNDEDASALVYVQLTGSGTDFETAFAETALAHDGTKTNYPSSAIMHDFRMAAFGCRDTPHSVYFSNLGDHSDFSTDNPPIADVKPGFSERIAACFSYLPQEMFIFKFPYGIYAMDTTGIAEEFATPPYRTIREDVGMAGEHGVARVGNDVWFIGADAHVYSLTSVQNSEDLTSSDITSLLHLKDWIKDNVNMSRLRFARIHYDTERQEAWIVYPKKGKQYNSIGLVIDLTNPGSYRIAIEDRGSFFQAMWPAREQDSNMAVRCAGEGGLVYKANQENRSINSEVAYNGAFEFPQSDLAWAGGSGVGKRQKRLDFLEIEYIPTGTYDLFVDITIDGRISKTEKIQVSSSSAVPLDLFVLDEDTLGGITLDKRKIKINGIGNKIGIRCRNQGLDENFEITSMVLYYKPLGIKGLI